jgi:hypothetical protein
MGQRVQLSIGTDAKDDGNGGVLVR